LQQNFIVTKDQETGGTMFAPMAISASAFHPTISIAHRHSEKFCTTIRYFYLIEHY
jgi:hypothetical protein